MNTFTVRDLRERTGQLIHDAELGKFSLITKHGRPIFLAVPFGEDLIEPGVYFSMALKLYEEGMLTSEKAAKIANLSLEEFIEYAGKFGVAIVNYFPADISKELKDFG